MEANFVRPSLFFLLSQGARLSNFFLSLFHRFDPDGKEWKERGVGKLKILKHPAKGTFRVLLRREQVHKIAVNHAISKDIELKPMQS